jgi:hypothetical protein
VVKISSGGGLTINGQQVRLHLYLRQYKRKSFREKTKRRRNFSASIREKYSRIQKGRGGE